MWRVSDLLGPSAYPGQDSEAEFRNHPSQDTDEIRPDYTLAPEQAPETLRWVATPLFVITGVSDVDDGLGCLGWTDHQPYAAGTVDLRYRWDAMWHIEEFNMSLQKVEKGLKTYTKEQGWNWEGLTGPDGDLVSFHKTTSAPGIGEINPGLKDWKNNEWSGMEMFDNPGHEMQKGFYGLDDYDMDIQDSPGGEKSEVYDCSECGYPASSYDDWHSHIMRDHVHQGPNADDADPMFHNQLHPQTQPVVDLDDVLPAQFDRSTMDPTVMRQSAMIRSLTAASPQISIPGPIPFIYSIDEDRIYVGHPGERHSDIKGRFTPGGVVEGTYDPKGNVQIRTATDMPYTVKHMGQLWYAMHPELEIKAIYLLVGQEKYKLASSNIGNKVRNILATDPDAYQAYQALSKFGTVYAVGGAVRDVILGKVPNDIDLMVQGVSADDVQEILEALPGRVDYTGKQFGVFRYKFDYTGDGVEVALPRKEQSTGEGHKDFDIQSDPFLSVEEDLARRDFTANAMAVNLNSGDLIDPYGGSIDIKNGELKTVSDSSFKEDPLRILRALTAISRHQLMPTPEVLEQIKENANLLDYVSAERVQVELDKMMKGSDPALAVETLERTGVFRHILPEYEKTLDFDQRNPHHSELLHDHLKSVLRGVTDQTEDPDLRWAGFLHDIGKPSSFWMDDAGKGHYYQHEDGRGADHWEKGADMSKSLLRRLKFPNDRIDRITHLVRHHMFPNFENEKGARKFINRVGDDHADDLLALRRADQGVKAQPGDDSFVDNMAYHIRNVREFGQPTSLKDIAINGNDLIAAGFAPGPQMGRTLNWLAEQVIENPDLNNRETLLSMAADVWDDSRTANILDPIKDSLDGDVFNKSSSAEPQVKPRLTEWIKKKVYTTMINAGWPDPANYLTLILTGSLTTYQWSEHSDMDVSLWIDAERLPEWVRADLIALMIEKCDGIIVPGTTHPLQCFVVDGVRYKPEDLYKPDERSGYNLETRQWIVPPERSRSINVYDKFPAVITFARDSVQKMKMMLRYDKYAVKTYYHFLHRQRFLAMKAGKGDYSEENIVYKMLSEEGLLPLIAEVTGEHIA